MVGLRRGQRDGDELSPTDERLLLEQQVDKLREEIDLKGRAVCSGWDAAAAADERLEVEVCRAFTKGREEGVEEHLAEMLSLNKSIELKEERISLMLVREGDMLRLVREAEKRELRAVEEGQRARIEALEAMAIIGASPGARGMVCEEEYAAVQDCLHDAHLEIVQLSEQCGGLFSSLAVSRQKIDVMVQLKSAMEAHTEANAKAKAASVCSEPVKATMTSAIEGLIAALKTTLSKGTVMWKNNRRDECYEVYSRACDEALPLLHTAATRSPLQEGIQQGRRLSLGRQKKEKEKGCTALKKALERLLFDLLQPHIRDAEENAGAERKSDLDELPVLLIEDASAVSGLLNQLDLLNRQEAAISTSCDARSLENPGATFEETALTGSGSEVLYPALSAPSTLLTRTVAAEARVNVLKRQVVDMAREKMARDDEAFELSMASCVAGPAGGSKGEAVAPESRQRPGVRSTSTVSPAEMRKLQRRVRELEAQIALGAQVQGPIRGQSEAPAAGDRTLLKKMKDMQSTHTREVMAIEGRAQRMELELIELRVASASQPLIVADRDQLRVQVRGPALSQY